MVRERIRIARRDTRQGVKTIAERAGTDPEVEALFRQYGRNLGEMLAPWADRFGAEATILGGNIAGSVELFRPALNEALSERGIHIAIDVCPLKERAALLGAARLFDESFWQRVKHDLPRA